jgi:Arc/MetJ-type ribon-helix-helix transcriptional regulator
MATRKKKWVKDRNISSKIISLRLKNEEIDAIDEIVKFSEFNSRNECVRYLLQPALAQFVTAINTKSAWQGAVTRIQEEMNLQDRLKLARKNSSGEKQLEIPQLDIDIQPA